MARRWRGPIVTENAQTGDGRVIAKGAVTWAELPLPLAWIRDGDQHIIPGAAPQVGVIESITREGDDLIGKGQIDDAEGTDGAELVRRMEAGLASGGTRQFLSIDPDDWAVEIVDTTGNADDEADGVLLLASAGRGPVPTRITAAAGDPDPGADGDVLMEDRSDAILERYTRMRIRGVTACAVSAFTTAWMELVDDAPETVVASTDGTPLTFTTNSGITFTDFNIARDTVPVGRPVPAPPAAAFALPEPEPGAEDDGSLYGMPVQELLVEQPDGGLGVPFTIVERDGWFWCFGHAARWGQCHVGYPGQCITAPESHTAYAHFHHGSVLCDDGSKVATGPLTLGTDHAAAHLLAPEARDHYANTGLAFADVRATNGGLGVWMSGVLRPTLTAEQRYIIAASSLSGDWRNVGEPSLEFIGALLVSVPGFGIARELVASAHVPQAALVASAYTIDGVQQSLVASGIVQRCPDCARRQAAEQALLAAGQISHEEFRELLGLVRQVEHRTRHLTPDAAEHALRQIRRDRP